MKPTGDEVGHTKRSKFKGKASMENWSTGLEVGIIEGKKPKMDVLEEEKLFSISGEIGTLLENLLNAEKKVNEDQT